MGFKAVMSQRTKNHPTFPANGLSSYSVPLPAQRLRCGGMIRPLLLLALGQFSGLPHTPPRLRQGTLQYSHEQLMSQLESQSSGRKAMLWAKIPGLSIGLS